MLRRDHVYAWQHFLFLCLLICPLVLWIWHCICIMHCICSDSRVALCPGYSIKMGPMHKTLASDSRPKDRNMQDVQSCLILVSEILIIVELETETLNEKRASERQWKGGMARCVCEVLNNWASLSLRTQSSYQLLLKNKTPNLVSNCWSLLFSADFAYKGLCEN